MTVKEARDSFDRMLETAKREGVVGLEKAMRKLSAEAATNGLTEEKLAEILADRPDRSRRSQAGRKTNRG